MKAVRKLNISKENAFIFVLIGTAFPSIVENVIHCYIGDALVIKMTVNKTCLVEPTRRKFIKCGFEHLCTTWCRQVAHFWNIVSLNNLLISNSQNTQIQEITI